MLGSLVFFRQRTTELELLLLEMQLIDTEQQMLLPRCSLVKVICPTTKPVPVESLQHWFPSEGPS